MFPFAGITGLILTQTELLKIPPKELDCGFTIQKQSDNYVLIKSTPDQSVSHLVMRQSTSHLPISIRNDRFRDRNGYSNMYIFKGLIDRKHYNSIRRILKSVNDWDFNIFSLERFSSGCPLTYLSIEVFEMHNLISKFQLDISKLYQFFITIEQSYHQSNPYHNALHAADVTQAINCIIQDEKIFKYLTPTDILCSLLSTICHDVDHPGLNNVYLNNSNHYLSILYKKESVLENHHWAFSLSVIKETGIFSHFDQELWKKTTDSCASLIRATDISKQSIYISNFKKHLLTPDNSPIESPDEKGVHLILQMAIKCADICNPCRRWDISNCWAYLVTEEFFQQGDREKLMSLPISPIMDREKCKLAVIQRDFIRYLVLPLFDVWSNYIQSPLSEKFLSSIKSNHAEWQRLAELPNRESESVVLACVDSQLLLDRLQLMQVMDYSHGHQLTHLRSLLLSNNKAAQVLDDSLSVCDNIRSGRSSQHRSVSIDKPEEVDMEEEEDIDVNDDDDDDAQIELKYKKTIKYPKNTGRRCSLPTTLQTTRENIFSKLSNQHGNLAEDCVSTTATTSIGSSNPRQKIFTRRTSLQTGPGFTTSILSNSMLSETSAISNVSTLGSCNSPSAIDADVMLQLMSERFPTSCRRASAPAVRAVMETVSQFSAAGHKGPSGRRSSLTNNLCSSQLHLRHQHAHSLSDIQITQVG